MTEIPEVLEISFLDLVREHFKDDPDFNLEKYLMKYHYGNDDGRNYINNVEIRVLLPDSKYIINNEFSDCIIEDNKIGCYIENIELCSYKEYYIIYKYGYEADFSNEIIDMKRYINMKKYLFLTSKDHGLTFSEISIFYDKCIEIIPKKKFNHYIFLDNCRNMDMYLFTLFFKNMYPETHLNYLHDYVDLTCKHEYRIVKYIDDVSEILTSRFISEIAKLIIDQVF